MTTTALNPIYDDLDAIVEEDAPIGPLTWYRVGGRADALVKPRTPDALSTLLRRAWDARIPVRVLGTGANLLVHDDGVDGIVIQLSEPAFTESANLHRHRPNRGDGVPGDGIRVMAGEKLERLIKVTARRGMRGIERLAGIPASVGGAIRMNAGGKWGSIGDAISAVGCYDVNGELRVYQKNDIEFDYRRCSLIDPVILWAELQLKPDDPELVHRDMLDTWHYKKNSQPLGEASVGCVFKNPFDLAHPKQRVSAGRVIDRAGLKGLTHGGAVVSETHANFIVAQKGCTANDILDLIATVEQRVKDASGYELTRELVVWKRRPRQSTPEPSS